MPAAPTAEASQAQKEGINRMADKFSAFMKSEGRPEPKKPDPAPEPEAKETPTPELPKETAKAELKAIVPQFQKPEVKAQPAEKSKEQPKHEKIPAENFRILEGERDKFRKAAEEKEAKLVELQAKLDAVPKTDPEKIKEAEKKLAEYETIVSKFYLENDPRFIHAYGNKIEEYKGEAKSAVGSEHAPKLDAILAMPMGEARDKQVKELAAVLEDDFDRMGLRKAYDDLKRIEKERSMELAKAPENLKKLRELQAQEAEQAVQKRLSVREQALGKTLAVMADIAEFRAVDGQEEHNQRVNQNISMAKAFLRHDLPDDEVARMAAYAVKGYRSLETDAYKDALIAKLQAQISDMQGSAPNTSGSGGANGEKASKAKTPGEKFREAMERGVPERE